MSGLTEKLYEAIVLFFAITGNALSDEDKADLHRVFTEENVV